MAVDFRGGERDKGVGRGATWQATIKGATSDGQKQHNRPNIPTEKIEWKAMQKADSV